MNDISAFYRLSKAVEENEALKDQAEQELKLAYAKLVYICPHSESIQHQFNTRGTGSYRVCKICGIEDLASKGGTPGDEYDYGYPGSPDEDFWGDSDVEFTQDEKRFWSFRRQHGWVVRNGKPHYQFKT